MEAIDVVSSLLAIALWSIGETRMAHSLLFSSCPRVRMPRLMLALLALMPAGPLSAQDREEPVEFSAFAELLVAPTRLAWRSALSPDESWVATSYGLYQGNLGRLRIWETKSGKVLWEVTEKRGIRRVV